MNKELLGLLIGLTCFGLSMPFFMHSAQATEMVVNGDFESDADLFVTWPGYTGSGSNPADITGWTGAGGRGINPVVPGGPGDRPFLDNGDNSTSAAFLQGTASITQDIPGFTLGEEYTLSLDFNARNCCGDFPVAQILLDSIIVFSTSDLFPPTGEVMPVGGLNPWYSATMSFLATDNNITLTINSIPAFGGDASLLLDNISITSASIPEPTTLALMGLGLAGIGFAKKKSRVKGW